MSGGSRPFKKSPIRKQIVGTANNHHKIEAIFKAFARALKEASTIVSDKLPSSKGVLE